MLLDLLSTNSDWTLTMMRIILGVVFFAHGCQKLFGWFGGPGLKQTILTMHESLGVPVPLAFLAAGAEFFGGLGMVVGLLSRLAAAGIAAIMLVAILLVNRRYGLFLNWFGDREGNGYEYHLLAIALAAAILVKGAGAASLDRLLYMSLGA